MGEQSINISKSKKSYSICPKYSEFIKKNFLHVQKVGLTHCKSNFYLKNRTFNSILVVFILDGKGVLEYENNVYKLNKSDVFIINCNFPHTYYPDEEEPMSMLYLYYAPPEFGIKVEVYTNFFLQKNIPVVSSSECSENIANIIYKIFNELKEESITSYLTCSTYIYDIVVEFLKLNEINYHNATTKIVPQHISKTKEYIENNCEGTLCIDTIAKNVSLSSYHLIREFKKYVGYTPYEYLLICKFEESKKLLSNTNLNINEIATKLNFSSSSHFISFFTKRVGYSPLKFRQKHNILIEEI